MPQIIHDKIHKYFSLLFNLIHCDVYNREEKSKLQNDQLQRIKCKETKNINGIYALEFNFVI